MKTSRDKSRLTQWANASGCGCKMPPAQLKTLLAGLERPEFAELRVGFEHSDDAAALQIPGTDQLLLSTADFFSPIVDNPYDFGRVAAANALSDVFAMGGRPCLALGLLAWPVQELGLDSAAEVMRGAQDLCTEERVPLAGGHSIVSEEPFFGLAVQGLVAEMHLKTNRGAQAGDLLYLTKPLGTGIMAAALRKGVLETPDYYGLLEQLSAVNRSGAILALLPEVHAMTDLTGFGLLGHVMEMLGPSTGADIWVDHLPLLEGLEHYLKQNILPDQCYRNWNHVEARVTGLEGPEFAWLCDPQTNGGLLVAVHPSAAAKVELVLDQAGVKAYGIGRFHDESEGIRCLRAVPSAP
jgi:selenide,water dikinase